MIITSDILLGSTIKGTEEEKLALAKQAIIGDFVKQLMNSENFLEIQKQDQGEGTIRYFCDFLVFNGKQSNKVIKLLNKNKF